MLIACRVAALMREPSLQHLFHSMSNPQQTRAAVDEGNGASEMRTRAYMDFAFVFNDHSFCPHFAVDVKLWVNVTIDVTLPPFQKPWIWVAEAMTEIKRKMTLTLRNFSTSGNLANDSNDMSRDMQFWCDFCNGDPVIFYTYMAWDHGKDVPSWNSTLLPPAQRLEIGAPLPNDVVEPPQNSSSKSKRGRDDLSEFVDLQAHLFRSIVSNPSSASTEVSTSLAKLQDLSKTADLLREQLNRAAEDRKLFDFIVSSSKEGPPPSASTFDYEGHVHALQAQLYAVMTKMSQVAV